MKNNLLQGRAFYAALFVLLLSVVGMKNAFAQTQVATLQHGDNISVFYGTNAFVEAHTAAQTGDIITLSSGTFVPTTITKGITLRGAGCAVDTVAGTNPTIFGGDITLNIADTVNALTVEGILFTNKVEYQVLYTPIFNRCNFSDIWYFNGFSNMYNAQFVNCFIKKFDFNLANNTVLINSLLWDNNYLNSGNSLVAYNSIIRMGQRPFNTVSAYNSIIIRDGYYWPNEDCSFINCIGIMISGDNYGTFGSGYTSGCVEYTSYSNVFESFTGTFSLDEPFVLKDEIATGFLGNDGTQVGIHGGIMPYSNRPSYMVLKRCNVANKSTIDGKLSVDIEVVTEEE